MLQNNKIHHNNLWFCVDILCYFHFCYYIRSRREIFNIPSPVNIKVTKNRIIWKKKFILQAQ